MKPRYKLRTLLIMLAVLPPVLAGAWFALVWTTRDGNLQIVELTALFSAIYVGAVILAIWAKRLALAALAYLARRIRE